jgi:hypothetical protein
MAIPELGLADGRHSVDRLPAILATVGVVLQGVTAVIVGWGHPRPPIRRGSAMFQHAGWLHVTGAPPYTGVWDPKPPLTFETPAVVALFVRNVYTLHLVHVGLMCAAAIGSMVLVGLLTERLTEDPVAGLVGGVSLAILPGFLVRPTLGYKPKYYVLVFGLLALYLSVRRRHGLGGIAAGIVAGFWQVGIIYPLVVATLGFHRDGCRGFARAATGVAVAAGAMLLPIAAWGVLEPMVVQAVIVPFLFLEEFTLLERLAAGVFRFKYGSVPVVLGVVGLLQSARRKPGFVRREWWLYACAGGFGLVALFIDFDIWSYTDLIPGLPFVAMGLGLLYADLDPPEARRVLVAIVTTVVVINVLVQGGFGVAFQPVRVPEPTGDPPAVMTEKTAGYEPAPAVVPDPRYLYWHRIRPENCHVRYSVNELRWIRATGEYPSCDGDLQQALDLLR